MSSSRLNCILLATVQGGNTWQCNSDTNYGELGQILQVKTVLTVGTASSGVPRPPALLTIWLQIQGPHCSLGFGNSLEWLQELRKVLYQLLYFFIKDTNEDQSKEETHRMMTGKTPKARFYVLRHFTLPKQRCLITNKWGNELRCPEFLLEFHYTGIIVWFIGYMI